jgi:TatD DNase family protein
MSQNKKITFIDSHCHLSNSVFDEHHESILREANENQIGFFLQGGYGPDDWKKQISLCNSFKGILPVFGLHPEWIAMNTPTDVDLALDELARTLHRASALGEVGIDLREKYEKSFALQMDTLEKQIELARIANLPLIFHIVKAHYEFIRFIEEFPIPQSGGLVHSFNGSWETAKTYMDHGLLISISGSITYEKNKKLREAVRQIPLEFLLLETDCPDQKPFGWPEDRLYGPSGLWKIAETVGKLRGLPAEELLVHSRNNLVKLLPISKTIT